MNRLTLDRQSLILRLLCEGNSIRGTARVTDTHKNTVERLIVQFGQAAKWFLDEQLRGLTLDHIEVDEIWTFVAKKQARLTLEERAERHDIGDVYLWTCLDQRTKLVAAHLLGKRSADNARRLMTDLASRLRLPRPQESDDHAFEQRAHRTVIQLSTDGFTAYPEAVDLAFGPYMRYGQIIKVPQRHDAIRSLGNGRHRPSPDTRHRRPVHDMHVARRAAQPHDPHFYKAGHPAVPWVQ